MVAACPNCEARYRVDVSRLPAAGARLRCSRCDTVFAVRRPAAAPPAATAVAVPGPPAPKPVPTAAAGPGREAMAPEFAPPPAPAERERLVLVAHPDVEVGKEIADALASWGLDVRLAHDGVEAILCIQRALPRLVILDAALPRMFGFQVCELVKRNDSLKHIAVVLMGGAGHQRSTGRAADERYGADAYLERQQVPGELAPLLGGLGLGRRPAEAGPEAAAPVPVTSPEPAAAPAPPSPPLPRASSSAPAPGVESDSAPSPPPVGAAVADPGARESAERLARIIVSDIVLYNGERFEAALGGGDVLEAMADELAEGRELLGQRVSDPALIEGLLEGELLRVARARGMQG